jgi:regulator of PEP synthase PpsR (kinase-PPPase family)
VKKIIIVSDGTGRTARRLMDAVLAQYSGHETECRLEKTYSGVRSLKDLAAVMDEMEPGTLVIFSLIAKEFRTYFHRRLHEEELLHLNILEPMLATMTKFLGFHPQYKPGLLQIIDEQYYKKVDAIGFTVEHDDGLGHQLEEADLVIVGPSRTCKTPISMFLACNHGMKIANIPTGPDPVQEKRLIGRLKRLDQQRIVGLTMKPEVLAQVRQERVSYLVRGEDEDVVSKYSSLETAEQELAHLRKLCNRQGWIVVNVTRRAIEEIASEIRVLLEFEKPVVDEADYV